VTLRASLHYGEEVHQSVKNYSPRHGYLRQAGEDEKTIKNASIFNWSWSSPEAKFNSYPWVLRSPKKLDLQRTPLPKSVRHIGSHVIFSSMYKVLHRRTLDCTLNHHWIRVSVFANQISKFH